MNMANRLHWSILQEWECAGTKVPLNLLTKLQGTAQICEPKFLYFPAL
jgi:hypothetical protein